MNTKKSFVTVSWTIYTGLKVIWGAPKRRKIAGDTALKVHPEAGYELWLTNTHRWVHKKISVI